MLNFIVKTKAVLYTEIKQSVSDEPWNGEIWYAGNVIWSCAFGDCLDQAGLDLKQSDNTIGPQISVQSHCHCKADGL